MSNDKRIDWVERRSALSRRDLMRRIGVAGVGAVGLGLVGCKDRPDQDIIDLTNDPQLLQLGGTFSGTVRGMLSGDPAIGIGVRLVGLGEIRTDDEGRFEVRVQTQGDYEIEFTSGRYVKRSSVIRINSNVSLTETLLEVNAGLPKDFLSQYARATGPNSKEGIAPRTVGASNRWVAPPRIVIYRRMLDNPKRIVPASRISAISAAIATLYPQLTANRLGGANIEIDSNDPPSRLRDVPRGVLGVGQRFDGLSQSGNGGSVSDPFELNRALIATGVDAPITLFNRYFGHGLGNYVVANQFDSIMNAAGRATPSATDLDAATFMYSRVAGNLAPDTDPPGVLING